MSLLKASDILEMHLFFVNRMGVVASALAYLYIVCKNKCIDMKATMCTTSCGMSALFGRVGGWKDPSVEPRSCGSGSLPPSDPFRTCGFDRCPRHRGLQSRLHILSIVFFNLCPLLELGSDKSRLPEEDSGWSVREAKLSRNSVFSMQWGLCSSILSERTETTGHPSGASQS